MYFLDSWYVLSFRGFNRSDFLSLLLWMCALCIVVVAVSTSITWCHPRTARPCPQRRRKTWRVHHRARSALWSDLPQDLAALNPWMTRCHVCQWIGVQQEHPRGTRLWPVWRISGHWCDGWKMYGSCIIPQKLACELGLLSVSVMLWGMYLCEWRLGFSVQFAESAVTVSVSVVAWEWISGVHAGAVHSLKSNCKKKPQNLVIQHGRMSRCYRQPGFLCFCFFGWINGLIPVGTFAIDFLAHF